MSTKSWNDLADLVAPSYKGYENLLLIGFGVGLSWGATIVKFDRLK